jgi:alpha-galactosidase
MAQGKYNTQAIGGWNPMKMLCLGDSEVEAHLRKELLGIVDRFHLDWLKWDASGLPGLDIVCDRADHGHEAGNGSQAAVFAKYRILDALHAHHPDLILEQCSYGTRLDYGMGRHGARVNWLSDSTAPSSHVRENVMAAAYVLPSSCNMAWVMRDQEVTQSQTPEFLDTLFRSRMMGSFGFGTMHGSLSECVSLYPPAVVDAAARNVANYKRYRHLLSQNEYHLTPWKSGNDWQAMQFAARNHGEGVGFFFRNGSSDVVRRFQIRGLAPDKDYEVASLNAGSSKVLTGSALSEAGVEINLERDPQASEILWFKAATRSKR